MILVDTSAFFAASDRSDRNHTAAVKAWQEIIRQELPVFTHGFVVIETAALMHRRLGHGVATRFLSFLEGVEVVWVDGDLYRRAEERYLRGSPADLSLVDCVSFALMRSRGLEVCFTFDRHFEQEGFRRMPE